MVDAEPAERSTVKQIRIVSNTWVFVCDGMKAIMLRNGGDALKPKLAPVDIFVEPHPPTRDIGSDRPGRVRQSRGSARSALDDTDWHDAAEADFIRKLAGKLDRMVRENAVTDLIIVAPPKALGILRDRISNKVRSVIFAEVAKDFTKMTIDEITRHLVG